MSVNQICCISCYFTKMSHVLWPSWGWKRLFNISKLKGSPLLLSHLPDGSVCQVSGYMSLMTKNKINGLGSFLPSSQSSWNHKCPLSCEGIDFSVPSPVGTDLAGPWLWALLIQGVCGFEACGEYQREWPRLASASLQEECDFPAVTLCEIR